MKVCSRNRFFYYKIGARRAIVEEPLTWPLDVPIEWRGAKDRSRGAGKPV